MAIGLYVLWPRLGIVALVWAAVILAIGVIGARTLVRRRGGEQDLAHGQER